MEVRNICCIGAGYVGGPTMSVIAQKCPQIRVTVVDIDRERIDAWNSSDLNKLPVYEPGLPEVIFEARNRNLFFSTNIDAAITEAQMIFISVNTPTKTYGKGKGMAADLKFIELCARKIASIAIEDKIIVEKSTLPVRTAEILKEILDSTGNGVNFHILSNPEFLAEGTAIQDLTSPDRVLIGGENPASIEALVNIYKHWVKPNKILTSNVWSSELAKLVANAFLAQRVSSINSISELCEKTGANIDEVAHAVGTDSRIGPKFLNASVGFGGSCFKKDILNLVYIARSYGLNEVANYWEQVVIINQHQKQRFADKIIETMFNTISGKKITFYGWAFKKNTNDSRESPAIDVAETLLSENAEIVVYDPKVKPSQVYADLNRTGGRTPERNKALISVATCPYEAITGTHAIVVLTEWDEFKMYDWGEIKSRMKEPAFVFDGRRLLVKNGLSKIGFNYFVIGQ